MDLPYNYILVYIFFTLCLYMYFNKIIIDHISNTYFNKLLKNLYRILIKFTANILNYKIIN